MADDQVESLTIELLLKEAITSGAPRVVQSLKAIEGGVRELQERVSVGELAGGFGIYEVISKSLESAKQADQALARLRAAIGGNDSAVKQLQDLVKTLSTSSVYSQGNILTVAADLLNRGVPQSQLPDTLRATIELASALRIDLDTAGKELAATYGGTVPRDLGRAIPQLREMSAESLKMGDAIGVVMEKLGGQAGALANTPFGRIQQQANELEQEYEGLGDQLVKLEADILPALVSLLRSLNDALESPAGQKFVAFLGQAIPQVARIALGLAVVSGAVRAFGPIAALADGLAVGIGKIAVASEAAAAATEKLTVAQQRMRDRRSAAFTQSAASGVAGVAGGYLGYQAGGTSGAAIGAIAAGASSNVLVQGAVIADAGYTLALRIIELIPGMENVGKDFNSLDKQIGLVTSIFEKLADGSLKLDDVFLSILATLGINQSAKLLTKDDLVRMHFATGPHDYYDNRKGEMVHDPGNADEVYANYLKEHHTTGDVAKDRIAADNAAAPSPEQLESDHQKKQLESEAGLLSSIKKLRADSAAEAAAEDKDRGERGDRAKLDAQLITLQEYANKKFAIEQEVSARIAALNKQGSQAQATIDYFAGTSNVAARIAAEQKLLTIDQERLPLERQLKDLTAADAAELLQLAQRKTDSAQRDLEQNAGRSRDLVKQGQESPGQGRTETLEALSVYQSRLEDIRAVLQQLAQVQGDVGDRARQMLADLNQEADDTAGKVQKSISDVRSVGQAGHDAALSLQQTTQTGLTDFLDEVITKAKSAGDALREFGKSIADNILHSATGRISELAVGALSGGTSGGGIFGSIGKLAVGDISGLFGGSSGAAASGTAAAASSSPGILSSIFSTIGALFGSGGYTGDGRATDPAGIVHKGEYVLNAGTVRAMGGRSILDTLVSRSISAPSMSQFASLMSPSGGGGGFAGGPAAIGAAADRFHAAVSDFADAQSQPRVHVAVPVTGELAQQIYDHPDSPAILAAMMGRNQQTFGPIIASMNAANGG